jgi:hypothetical protein
MTSTDIISMVSKGLDRGVGLGRAVTGRVSVGWQITTTKPIGKGLLKEDVTPQFIDAKRWVTSRRSHAHNVTASLILNPLLHYVLSCSADPNLKASVLATPTPFDPPSTKNNEITDEERHRINMGLWNEHRQFMERLHKKRYQRHSVEVRPPNPNGTHAYDTQIRNPDPWLDLVRGSRRRGFRVCSGVSWCARSGRPCTRC